MFNVEDINFNTVIYNDDYNINFFRGLNNNV